MRDIKTFFFFTRFSVNNNNNNGLLDHACSSAPSTIAIDFEARGERVWGGRRVNRVRLSNLPLEEDTFKVQVRDYCAIIDLDRPFTLVAGAGGLWYRYE